MQEFEKSVWIWEKTAWICFPASWFLVSHPGVVLLATLPMQVLSVTRNPIHPFQYLHAMTRKSFCLWLFLPDFHLKTELAVSAAFNTYCLPDIVSLKIQPVPINSINVDTTQAKQHTCHFFIQSCANMYLTFHRNVQSFLKMTLSTAASVFSWAI